MAIPRATASATSTSPPQPPSRSRAEAGGRGWSVPQVSHLGVQAVEYSYTLSRPEVSVGEAIVELNNQGEDPPTQ